MMMITVLASFLLLVQHIIALSINIKAGEVDCYYEYLEVGEKLIVSYQVGDGGNYDIDFWIKDPQDTFIISKVKQTSDAHSLTANIAGKYTFCFSNEFSTVSDKKIGFNVHENIQKIHESVKENTDPLEKEISELAESVFNIKAQQEYIIVRERQHRDTAESTNARVKWWSIAQLGLLVSVCFWQVYYLKRFFEVKRAV
ncbi:supernatant protein factor C-terminal domain-containing protein [Rhizopus microsporus var. microsporus]|uniref:COPII-coated vesicle protein n=2 Tax=Rhizopus microsporus TaxID=58291 RepID=A0A2G4SIH6_RHIZD|nr:COPII-coated vesicle protein [Rhizopus microsporus ATCC 52813]ORE05657.1 supernatant protein factor C-terminal domain-containing protein [Rhizopus microsporus var. microsporus]PHZ08565.1 COPII-coated vesicle protein [Rhizopus microsporus ATCC 52813]